jgi:hypothetical protein
VVYVLQVVRFVFRRVRHGDHEEGETTIA